MRAAVLRNTGDEKLEIVDDLELGPVGPGEVKVKIHATGVCHSDVSGMNGTIPQPAPFVPGHEGAGVVAEVGEGVTAVQPGDHVIIAWSAPCGTCKFCVDRKQPNLCVNVQMAAFGAMHFSQGGTPIFGFAGSGTWAEEMIMPQQGVVKIDPATPHEIASLVGCGVMTGVGAALNTAKVTPGSSVVVFGCGGVGISAIQGAKVAGASEIVAVDLVDSKLEDAQRFGATHAVKPDELESAKASITGGDGFDYAFEAIGLPQTMRQAVQSLGVMGRAVIAGISERPLEIDTYRELLGNEAEIIGSNDHLFQELPVLLELARRRALDTSRVVTRVVPLEAGAINQALDELEHFGSGVRTVIVP